MLALENFNIHNEIQPVGHTSSDIKSALNDGLTREVKFTDSSPRPCSYKVNKAADVQVRRCKFLVTFFGRFVRSVNPAVFNNLKVSDGTALIKVSTSEGKNYEYKVHFTKQRTSWGSHKVAIKFYSTQGEPEDDKEAYKTACIANSLKRELSKRIAENPELKSRIWRGTSKTDDDYCMTKKMTADISELIRKTP